VLERAIWALGLVGSGVVAYLLLRRAYMAWVQGHAPSLAASGRPTLLYFSTPGCAPCWSLQAPAVAQVEDELGEAIRVLRIDGLLEPEEADRWGVLSVPTTTMTQSVTKRLLRAYGNEHARVVTATPGAFQSSRGNDVSRLSRVSRETRSDASGIAKV